MHRRRGRPEHHPPHLHPQGKGLDAKAVILIGLPTYQELDSDYDHYSWFMAVSRARQLLAVVENG
jgi:hypothetical protein